MDLVFTDPAFAEQKQQYLDYILQQAPRAKDFKKPILVRELTGANKVGDPVTPELLKEFATASNEAAVSALSATEQAKRDADALNLETLDLYKGGSLTNTNNAMFISAFDRRVVPKSEQGQFYNKGALTLEGEKRIQHAILAKAYDYPTALERMLASTGTDNVKALSEGLRDAAPAFAKLKVADNITEEMKAIPQKLVDAVNKISDLRNDKTIPNPVKEYFNQGSLFQEDADPIRDAFIAAFYNEEKTRPKSKEFIRDMVQFLVDEVMRQEPGGLPGLENTVEAGTVIDIAESKAREREDVRKERRNARKQKSLPGIDEARSESVDADSEQAQPSGRKKSRTKAKRDSGPELDADTSTRGEPEVSRRDTEPGGESKPPPGTRPGEISQKEYANPRISIFRQAFTDYASPRGQRWQDIENKTPIFKRNVLKELIQEKFQIPYIATSPTNIKIDDDLDNLLDAYRQLQVMANVLQLPNSAISLNGDLGLALPGKDWGGYYAAFYNEKGGDAVTTKSDLPEIAAPFIIMPPSPIKGLGRSLSFGHEWGHALDYHILSKLGTDWDRGMSARIRPLKKDDSAWLDDVDYADDPHTRELQLAFGEVMNALFFDMDEVASTVMKLEHSIARKEMNHLRDGKKLGENESESLSEDRRKLKSFIEGSSNMRVKGSQYIEDVQAFSKKPYWQRPTEMFARAFEMYLAHKITQANFTTEFLTSSDAAYQMSLDEVEGADKRFPLTHPQESERNNVILAFERLFASIQTHPDFLEGDPAAAPGDYDILDLKSQFTGVQELSVWDPKSWSIWNAEVKRSIQAARNHMDKQKMRPLRYGEESWRARTQMALQDQFYYPFLRSKTATVIGMRNRIKKARPGETAADRSRRLEALEAINYIQSAIFTEPGASFETHKDGVFPEAVKARHRIFAKGYIDTVKKHELDLITPEQEKTLELIMVSDPETQAKLDRGEIDQKLVDAAADLRILLNKIHRYVKGPETRVDINYLPENGYLPRVTDTIKVFGDKQNFLYGPPGSTQKGAKPLYYEILWPNDHGEFVEPELDENGNAIPDSVDQILSVGKEAMKQQYNELAEDPDSPVSVLRDIFRTITSSQNAMKKALKQFEQDAISEKDLNEILEKSRKDINEAVMLNPEALEDAYYEVGDLWAEFGAQDWLHRIEITAGEDPNAHSPMGRFTKSRVLPREADTYMREFYMDGLEAISNYITSAVRKAEYNRRFGTHLVPRKQRKDPITKQPRNYLDYLFQEKLSGVLDETDIRQLRLTIQHSTGTQSHFQDDGMRKALQKIHAIGTMSLLSRAAISSIAEPLTAGVQSESVLKGMEAMALTIEEVFSKLGTKNMQERVKVRRQLANILGVVDDPEIGDIISNRLGGSFADDPALAKRMQIYFRRTLLTGYTNASRRASMRIGIQFLKEMSQEYLDNPGPGYARDTLLDFGITDNDMKAYAEYMTQFNVQLPDIDALLESDGQLHEMGRLMSISVGRFTNWSIQDPDAQDRPRWAEHPVGQLVFGITSFSYAYGKNVLVAGYKKTKREYTKRGLTSGNLMAARLSGAMFSVYLGHTIVNAFRERLTNEERWKEKKEKGELGRYLLEMGIYRAGIVGAFDPLFQAWRSLKYQVDLGNLFIGAGPTMFARAFEKQLKALNSDTNSANTPAAEYQGMIGFIEAFLVPATAWFIGSNPNFAPFLGMAQGPTAAGITAAVSSPDFKHMIAKSMLWFLTGETYTPRKGRQAKKRRVQNKSGKFTNY